MKTLKWIVGLFTALGLVFLLLFVVPIKQVHAQVASQIMDWTATGDDGTVGTATSQEIRWAATRPDTTGMGAWIASGGSMNTMPPALASWWSAATRAPAMPAPRIAGTAESFAVSGPFTTGSTYWFLLQVCDERPNCVGSNLAAKFFPDLVPPSPIVDFRAR
jgi:hypothetical protein